VPAYGGRGATANGTFGSRPTRPPAWREASGTLVFGDNGRVQVAILGPLEVSDDGGAPVVISGARLRDLIVRLALAGGRPVSTSELGDAVWGDEPPADLANALQTLVSRARRALGGAQAVEQSPAGYRLAIKADDVDAFRFQRLLAEGRTDEAMRLWRGPALADAGEFAAPHAQRLERLQLDALVTRLAAEVAQDPAGGDVALLEVLVANHPLHEKLTGLLMRALAASGRQAEALAAYGAMRERLADELGIDPGAELQAVHLEVLRGEAGNGAGRANGSAASADTMPGGPRARTNLRAQLTSFVGREDDVARVIKALEQYRLVTLVGPGGTGKTRLATEVAAVAAGGLDGAGNGGSDGAAVGGPDGAAAGAEDVSDGVWLAELASVTDPGDVPQSVLNSIGLREPRLLLDSPQRAGNRDARTRLLDGLVDAHALLVLDNCEHLIDACAHLADELLSHCPGLRIVATSREPLGITGESLLSIAPLSQPMPGAPAQEAVGFPAVRLFAERAAAVSPGFEVDDETVALVIDIVRRLDGLPLAIELAAARLRTLPLAEVARRLNDRFRLLTGGSRTALPRHRTLRAVVEWSWDLLTPEERLLAERFAVFPAGATPGAVAVVCAGPGGPATGGGRADVDPADVDDLLSSLVDKSLLQPVRGAPGEAAREAGGARLRMLETVREYGSEQLAGRGELAELLRRHAVHYSALMAKAAPRLLTRDQVTWLPVVTADRDNLLAALRYWCDVGDAWQALTLAVGVSGMALLLGNYSDITDWVGQALEVPADVGAGEDLRTIAEALYQVNQNMQMYERSPADGAQSTAAAASPAVPTDLTERVDALDFRTLPLIGLLREMYAFFSDDRERLGRYIDEAIGSGDEWLVAVSWMMRAILAENDGEVDALRIAADGALQRYRALGERWGLSSTLRLVGTLCMLDGDLDGATAAYTEALAVLKELGSRDDEFMLRLQLADLDSRRGDPATAREGFEAALAAVQTSGWGPDEAIILAACARFEVAAGDTARARDMHAAAAARLRGVSQSSPIRQHLSTIVHSAGAMVALADGDVALARERAASAHATAVQAADMPLIASVALVTAELALATGDQARAAQLLAAAAVVRGADDPTATEVRSLSERLRLALGDVTFAESQAQGAELSRAAALALLDSALTG
jgi:predicted ATPase/DNA-binding SARP family transcriptional activator/tetratricopeptide (TPR) repeat protein